MITKQTGIIAGALFAAMLATPAGAAASWVIVMFSCSSPSGSFQCMTPIPAAGLGEFPSRADCERVRKAAAWGHYYSVCVGETNAMK